MDNQTNKTEGTQIEEPTKEPQVEELETTSVEKKEDVDILDAPYLVNPFFYEVANYFGVESEDFDLAKEKFADIVDWAVKEGKSKKPEDILLTIRKAEDIIKRPEWGERRYVNLHRYVRLASQKQAVEKAMSVYHREVK